MPVHEAHEFSRLLSTSDTGMALFGCAFRAGGTVVGCGETEVRGRDEPSPYAIKRAAAKRASAARKARRGGS